MKRLRIFVAALALAASGSTAMAQEGSGILRKIEFFSDAAYTDQTGEFVEFCDGTSTMNGQPDIHSRVFEYSC